MFETLIGFIILVVVVMILASGLGTLAGIISLFTHPVSGPRARKPGDTEKH